MQEKENLSKSWFDALHSDLKELNAKVNRIELSLAEMSGEKIGAKLEKHDAKIEKLEDFRSRVYGALVIINIIWGLVAAVILWKLTKG